MQNNKKYTLLVVGSGGTGTYFLKEISRYLASKKRDQIAAMYIIDGDIIEKKNLSRQAFIDDDIGRYKADVMAEVLDEQFGLKWQAVSSYLFEEKDILTLIEKNTIPVIIGCVDNHGCRILLEKVFYSSSNCIYFDAANEEKEGECVFSAVVNDVVYSPCRSYFFPDILEGDTRGRDTISCEELNNSAPQHILANMTSGLQLLSAFVKFFEDGTITTGYAVYNAFKFFTKSYSAEDCKWTPINRKEVAHV